jgi:hypothetical protein
MVMSLAMPPKPHRMPHEQPAQQHSSQQHQQQVPVLAQELGELEVKG